MIFIFDWGYKIESTIGPIEKNDISISGFDTNSVSDFVELKKVRVWFRAFFIPLIPTETHYFFFDSKRKARFDIGKSDFEKYKPLAELNKQVVENKISEEEFENQRDKIVL